MSTVEQVDFNGSGSVVFDLDGCGGVVRPVEGQCDLSHRGQGGGGGGLLLQVPRMSVSLHFPLNRVTRSRATAHLRLEQVVSGVTRNRKSLDRSRRQFLLGF